jgi:xanthine dehydrogenase accessory factor
MKRFTRKIDEAVARREPVLLCTVVHTAGSTPLKAGAKMLVWCDGRSEGTVGGGALENKVMADALRAWNDGVPVLKSYPLLKEQMCCGGTVQVFIEPLLPQRRLLIFGGGHVGRHVALFAQHLDFCTVMVDERPEHLEGHHGAEILCTLYREAPDRVVSDPYTYIVICTHSHEADRFLLAACLQQPRAYLGMIGSQRKVAVTRKQFLARGLATAAELDTVDMPIGWDVGQQSPAEIALGIIAKIVAVANGKPPVRDDEPSAARPEPDLSGCLPQPLHHEA